MQLIFPNQIPILEGQTIDLKPFVKEDAIQFFNLRSNTDFVKYLGMDPYHSIEQAEALLAEGVKQFNAHKAINWKICLKDSQELIGYVGLWRFIPSDFRGEIGFGLSKKYRGKGIAQEAISLCCRYGLKQMNVHSIYANIDPQNVPSIKSLEKVGFQFEGVQRESFYYNGKFYDSYYMGLLLNDLQNNSNS